MNKLIAVCYFVLSLYGCDVGGSTVVHRAQTDGSDILYSKVVAQPGVTRFECVRSASGRCYYTVFPRDCASAPGSAARSTSGSATESATKSTSKRIGRCPAAPVERFAIASGDRRQIPGLPSFHLCVSAEDAVPGPDCTPAR